MRHVLALLLVTALFLTGCEALEALNKGAEALNETLNNPDDGYNAGRRAKFPDQAMAQAFVDPAGKLVPELSNPKGYLYIYQQSPTNDFIGIEREKGKGHSRDTVLAARLAADSTRDDIAQLYIRTAHARGNTVRMYKPPISSQVEKLVGIVVKSERTNTNYYGDMDNALIEFDPSGRMVTALTRQVALEVGVITSDFADSQNYYIYERSAIWVNRAIRLIEGRLSNDLLAAYFLAELRPAQAQPVAVALPQAPAAPAAPQAPAASLTVGQMVLLKQLIKLYVGGSSTAEVVAAGTTVSLLSKSDNASGAWWFVDAAGRRGYVLETEIQTASR